MTRTTLGAAMIAIAALTTMLGAGAASAEPVSGFYQGRALTILVPSGAGGLNALYARTVGDRWGKHVPGNPKIIYQHMPGGGGIKGTNYCYNSAPKDGSMVCVPFNPLALASFFNPRVPGTTPANSAIWAARRT